MKVFSKGTVGVVIAICIGVVLCPADSHGRVETAEVELSEAAIAQLVL